MEWRKNKNLLGSNDFLAYEQNLFGCKNPEEKETKEYKIPNLKKSYRSYFGSKEK